MTQSQEFTADFRLNAGNPRATSQEELNLRVTEGGAGYRIAADSVPLRVPVVLNVQSSLLEFSALRAVVDALRSRAGGFLERNAMAADLTGAIEGAFVGPSHKFSD